MAAVIGTYGLVLQMPVHTYIPVGRLGLCSFPRGYYLYIGSALGGLDGRLRRHYRTNKVLRWHIDYLREKSDISYAFWKETPQSLECSWARALSNAGWVHPHIKGFGSSDCRCHTHLFYAQSRPRIEMLKKALGCSLSRWRATSSPR